MQDICWNADAIGFPTIRFGRQMPSGFNSSGNAPQHALCCYDMESTALNSEPTSQGALWRGDTSAGTAAERRASTIAYYEQKADSYAAMTVAIDTVDRITRFTALLPSGGHVLDAGCGAGRDLIGFKAAGLEAKGLDISHGLAAIAQKNSRLPVSVGDLHYPPFAPASFDGIWAMASLLHIERDNIQSVLCSLYDLLVPCGVLFASVKRGAGLVCDRKGRWFTLYDEASWSCYLRLAGFEIIEALDEPPMIDGDVGSVAPGWISSLARRPK
ncbi:class I SAM-dependent methyltransferase [Azospirillum isscasi]|uniref:Class I SAM-dependent methyltransferase n=1 Tax=Azospirillum isscasi TaxID=3053926 RepID=A0ABU0WHS0_9PROT|nr:class I SAM-dependent methyltransferase [Azospirillum isscasi]MDQ2102534.1 class I SAM-dependent methyltransferase [Azospirillum isscasi]